MITDYDVIGRRHAQPAGGIKNKIARPGNKGGSVGGLSIACLCTRTATNG